MNSNWVRTWGAVFLITASVWICYFHTLDAPMLFDDVHNIVENSNIQIEKLSFNSLYAAAFENPTPRPVAYLTLAANYYLGGLDVSGYHVVNILIHCLNGVIVFWLVQFMAPRLCNVESDDTNGQMEHWWIPLAAALLFVVHPVQTQSVTYIIQRMASLCATFYLAGLLTFLWGRTASNNSKRNLFWLLSLGCWVLALGTKQLAVTLPLAMLLCEWIIFRKGERQWLVTGAKYLCGIALLGGVVLFIFKGFDAHKLLTRGYTKRDFSLAERVMTEGRVMMHYLSLVVLPLPSRLVLVYDFSVSKSLLVPITTLLSWLTIFTALIWSFRYADRFPVLAFSILWFFLHMAVESTVIPLELVYEHRLYLPLFGVCLPMAIAISTLLNRNKTATVFSVALLCFLLGICTFARNSTWKTSKGIWQDNVAKQPNEPRSWFNLGMEFSAQREFEKANQAIQKSLELEPRLQQAYGPHAAYLRGRGELKRALAACDKGLAIPKNMIRGKPTIGDLFDIRVEILKDLGNLPEAFQIIDRLIDEYATARRHFLRAECFLQIKQPLQAIKDYESALELDADYFLALNNLAWLLATHPDPKIADAERAIALATHACELTDWTVRQSIVALAAAYARAGNFEQAVKMQNRGIEIADESSRQQLRSWLNLFQNRKPLIQ